MTPIYCMTVQMNRSCIFLPFVLVITPCMYVEICKSINFCCRLWIELNHHNFIQCFVLFLMLLLILWRHSWLRSSNEIHKKGNYFFVILFLTFRNRYSTCANTKRLFLIVQNDHIIIKSTLMLRYLKKCNSYRDMFLESETLFRPRGLS